MRVSSKRFQGGDLDAGHAACAFNQADLVTEDHFDLAGVVADAVLLDNYGTEQVAV